MKRSMESGAVLAARRFFHSQAVLRPRGRFWANLWAAIFLACAAAAGPTAGARAAETTRIAIQNVPYPGVRITVPSGQSIEAIPASSLGAAAAGRAAEIVILYAVPSEAFGQPSFRAQVQSLRNSGSRPRTVFLVSAPPLRGELPPHAGILRPGVAYDVAPSVRIFVRSLPVPGSGRRSGLTVLDLDAPHARTGILFPGKAEDRAAQPQEHDVLILPVPILETGIDRRTLSALDPEIAVLFGEQRGERLPHLDNLVDQLQDLWTDVYRVEFRRPFVIIAGPHGLFLPINGRRIG